MWIFICFDLPSKTKTERREYKNFRQFLLKQGFDMYQYSIYFRFCFSNTSKDTYVQRISKKLPNNGEVSILLVTNKQFKTIKKFSNKKREIINEKPKQLELF